MLRPRNDLILIKRIDEAEEGTIVLPDTAKVDSNKGRVIAVGRGEIIDGRLVPIEDIKPGDEVLFTKFSETPAEIEGEEFVLVRSCDVYAFEDGTAMSAKQRRELTKRAVA